MTGKVLALRLAAFVAFVTCTLVSRSFSGLLVDEAEKDIPLDNRKSLKLFRARTAYSDALRRHRALFPESGFRRKAIARQMIQFISFVLFMLSFALR
jgi:hypothetical protein